MAEWLALLSRIPDDPGLNPRGVSEVISFVNKVHFCLLVWFVIN